MGSLGCPPDADGGGAVVGDDEDFTVGAVAYVELYLESVLCDLCFDGAFWEAYVRPVEFLCEVCEHCVGEGAV